MAKKKEEVSLQKISPKMVKVTIEGTTDLVCNKMNDVVKNGLIAVRNDEYVDKTVKANKWEEIITSVHWLNKVTDFSEEGLKDALENNKPCFTAFGMMKAMGDAVVRNQISAYATGLKATINIIGERDNLIPFEFEEYSLDEKLMTPKTGRPVLARLNRFSNWKATFKIEYLESAYSLEQLLNIINLAGFGGGIGSGRSSGYGRFKVTNCEPC